MSLAGRAGLVLLASAVEHAQQTQYPKPGELPNPYRLVEGWPTLPASMDGSHWVSDVNDEETVLGMPAKNAKGVVMGQEVLKLSPAGKVLMTIGKEGVSGNGPDTFDRPTGVAVAPNGDVFVTDGHAPNQH